MTRLIRTATGLAFGALLVLAPAAARPAGAACVLHVSASTTLTHDLDASASVSDGICVEADNVTLDLNGHRIVGSGDDTVAGIRVAGRTGVTIKDGDVAGFGQDVLLEDATGALVKSLRLSQGDGVVVLRGSGARVKRIACLANVIVCVRLGSDDPADATTGALVSDSTATRPQVGLADLYGAENTFAHNTVAKASEFGIRTLETADDTISHNTATGIYGQTNVFLDSRSDGNRYVGNEARSGLFGFFLVSGKPGSPGVLLLDGNTATGNQATGFQTGDFSNCLCPDAEGSRITNNVASGNASGGFDDIGSHNATWSGNRATRNGSAGFSFYQSLNGTIVENSSTRNGANGFEFWVSDAKALVRAKEIARNRSAYNAAFGLYSDWLEPSAGNIATGNGSTANGFGCWNVVCNGGYASGDLPPGSAPDGG